MFNEMWVTSGQTLQNIFKSGILTIIMVRELLKLIRDGIAMKIFSFLDILVFQIRTEKIFFRSPHRTVPIFQSVDAYLSSN